MTTTYRKQFDKAEKAEDYDTNQYGARSYSDLLWQIERDQLAGVLAEMRKTQEHVEYLDFAAGTGRIIVFMEDKVDSATGIEISQAMVDRAQEKLSRGTMVCKDITPEGSEIEGQYDFITTFRFVLNAEAGLRQAGISALARRLKDKNSVLVFNNHGNPRSHKVLLWPVHKIRGRGKGYQTEGNYLSNAEAHRVADRAGLKIEKTIGCGFLGGTVCRVLPSGLASSLERMFSSWRILRPFCVNQMFVARLKG